MKGKNTLKEIIRQDFKGVVKSDKISWYYGPEGEEERPIGKPDDYLPIRDNYDSLRSFMSVMLDKGRVYYGIGHWNQDGETDCADYLTWLYQHSQDDLFKKNFECSVTCLLKEEADKRRVSYKDVERESLNEAVEHKKEMLFSLYKTNSLPYAIKQILNTWNGAKKRYNDHEVYKNGRNFWIIQEKNFNNPLDIELAEKVYHELENAKWNFDKLSESTINDLISLEMKNNPRKTDNINLKLREQYSRLIGLTGIIRDVRGQVKDAMDEWYPVLEIIANNEEIKNLPDVVFYFSNVNVYDYIIETLNLIEGKNGKNTKK